MSFAFGFLRFSSLECSVDFLRIVNRHGSAPRSVLVSPSATRAVSIFYRRSVTNVRTIFDLKVFSGKRFLFISWISLPPGLYAAFIPIGYTLYHHFDHVPPAAPSKMPSSLLMILLLPVTGAVKTLQVTLITKTSASPSFSRQRW